LCLVGGCPLYYIPDPDIVPILGTIFTFLLKFPRFVEACTKAEELHIGALGAQSGRGCTGFNKPFFIDYVVNVSRRRKRRCAFTDAMYGKRKGRCKVIVLRIHHPQPLREEMVVLTRMEGLS
jgi:hypothetical protein